MKFSEVRLNARNKSAGATEPQQRINVKTLAHEFSFIIIPLYTSLVKYLTLFLHLSCSFRQNKKATHWLPFACVKILERMKRAKSLILVFTFFFFLCSTLHIIAFRGCNFKNRQVTFHYNTVTNYFNL